MGEEPSHPELLDWLATELIARGLEPEGDAPADRDERDLPASVGRRSRRSPRPIRTTCSSAGRTGDGSTARRSATPCSSVSGSLNPAMKGPSVFPELPSELSKLSSKGAVWPVSAPARRPQPPQPLCLRPAQPALSLLRGVRSPGHECELPAPAGDDDRPAGAFAAQQQPGRRVGARQLAAARPSSVLIPTHKPKRRPTGTGPSSRRPNGR